MVAGAFPNKTPVFAAGASSFFSGALLNILPPKLGVCPAVPKAFWAGAAEVPSGCLAPKRDCPDGGGPAGVVDTRLNKLPTPDAAGVALPPKRGFEEPAAGGSAGLFGVIVVLPNRAPGDDDEGSLDFPPKEKPVLPKEGCC